MSMTPQDLININDSVRSVVLGVFAMESKLVDKLSCSPCPSCCTPCGTDIDCCECNCVDAKDCNCINKEELNEMSRMTGNPEAVLNEDVKRICSKQRTNEQKRITESGEYVRRRRAERYNV